MGAAATARGAAATATAGAEWTETEVAT
jgi:hypothetical protein